MVDAAADSASCCCFGVIPMLRARLHGKLPGTGLARVVRSKIPTKCKVLCLPCAAVLVRADLMRGVDGAANLCVRQDRRRDWRQGLSWERTYSPVAE